jgi:hypothetical protein
MPTYIALTYTAEVDWRQPEYADGLKEYAAFEQAHAACCEAATPCTPPRPPRPCGSQTARAVSRSSATALRRDQGGAEQVSFP